MADSLSSRSAVDPLYRDSSAAQALIDRAAALAVNATSTRRDLEARLGGVAFGAPPSEPDKAQARMVPDLFERLHASLDQIESSLLALQSLTDRVAL